MPSTLMLIRNAAALAAASSTCSSAQATGRMPRAVFVARVCVFITAGPLIKLCAGGEGDSEGHVL